MHEFFGVTARNTSTLKQLLQFTPGVKVVISGKYKNLNKITKNLTYLPEISQTSYFCYSPQFTMQNRGTCCLKKCFNTERSKGNFVRENLKNKHSY